MYFMWLFWKIIFMILLILSIRMFTRWTERQVPGWTFTNFRTEGNYIPKSSHFSGESAMEALWAWGYHLGDAGRNEKWFSYVILKEINVLTLRMMFPFKGRWNEAPLSEINFTNNFMILCIWCAVEKIKVKIEHLWECKYFFLTK